MAGAGDIAAVLLAVGRGKLRSLALTFWVFPALCDPLHVVELVHAVDGQLDEHLRLLPPAAFP